MTDLCRGLALAELDDSALELLNIQLSAGVTLLQGRQLLLLLLDEVVRVLERRTVEAEFGFHCRDRLLILLDDGANDLLVPCRAVGVRLGLALRELASEAGQLVRALSVLGAKCLVVVLELRELLARAPHGRAVRSCRASTRAVEGAASGKNGAAHTAAVLQPFELAPEAGDGALEPLDIVPTVLTLGDDRAVLNIPCASRVLERVDSLRGVPLRGAHTGDHECV
jgi:hypothetical protein